LSAVSVTAGLTPQAILEKLSAMYVIDVHLPTTDGKHIVPSRHTEPEPDVALLLAQLQLALTTFLRLELRNLG